MKNIFALLFSLLIYHIVIGQHLNDTLSEKVNSIQLVEVSCGECNFHMKGKSCDLAVRIDGHTYFVDGAKIDDFGNAHSVDGFCSAIRKAYVKGTVVNDRFKADYFKLVPVNDSIK